MTLMRRAWLLHSFKTTIQALVVTFGTSYWSLITRSNNEIEPECHLINQDLLEILGDLPKVTIVILLITSVLLDFTCWWRPKVSVTLMYFEVLWSFIDTIFVP